jgi:potassium-dependent mechanosensitive channel
MSIQNALSNNMNIQLFVAKASPYTFSTPLILHMRYSIGFLFCCIIAIGQAQNTSRNITDSIRKADSTRRPNRYFDSSLFSDGNVLTTSDYLLAIEKMQEKLNEVPLITASFYRAAAIQNNMNLADSAISVIKQGLAFDIRVLSLRNVQMFQTLVDNLQENNNKYELTLTAYDKRLDSLKKEILNIRKDTVLRRLFRDSVLRKSFSEQLKPIRQKWKDTDSLVRQATQYINNLRAHASQHDITIKELKYQTDVRLQKIGPRAFTKEIPYLWEPTPTRKRSGGIVNDYRKSADNLDAAARFYFINTRSQRLWLLAGGVVFFCWVFYNFLSIKRKNLLSVTKMFHFIFVRPTPIAASLIVMLALAPLLDLNAPAIYLEIVQFVLMIILTGVFWKRWPRDLFFGWCIIIALFLVLPIATLLQVPFAVQRWLMLLVNATACLFGIYFFRHVYRTNLRIRPNLLIASGFYTVLNALATLANLFGRLTLTKILGMTAVYGFTQMISLTVFVRIITEAFILQIFASRIRKNYGSTFEFAPIQKKLNRAATVLSIFLWLIVFTTNLNLYTTITEALHDFFMQPRQIGSFTFTIWGIILFGGIIWLANSLQKYIAYFFGDTGEDTGMDIQRSRSRLLVTRLVLLTGGFLLAVVASGLPVDKVTVVLGALGVGIGLGLQSIVNNFVSGIILIFDRPLRIGDMVELGDKKGRVKEIGIRASTLTTADGAEVIIPNGDILSHSIVNWTLTNSQIRTTISFSVENLPNEKEVKQEIVRIIKDNEHVIKGREPEILVNTLTAKKIQLSFMFWCVDVTRVEDVKSDISVAIYDYLKSKEIEIV